MTPAVTLRAKALRPFDDGNSMTGIPWNAVRSATFKFHRRMTHGTFAFGEEVIGTLQERGCFRRCRTGKAFGV